MNDGGASLGKTDDEDETKEMEENQGRAADGRTVLLPDSHKHYRLL